MLREYNEEKNKLSTYLPWLLFCDEGIILNKNGTLQKTIEYRGFDLDREEIVDLKNKTIQLNNIFKRISGGWTLSIDAIRKKCKKYIKSEFSDKAGKIIEEKRESFFNSGNHYESIYYITFIYLIPLDVTNKMSKLIINDIEIEEETNKEILKFKKEFEVIFDLFQSVFLKKRVRKLSDEETLTYLHSLISNTEQKVILPNPPIYLSNYISDTYVIGGLKPMLGKKYLRIISIAGFPAYTIPSFLEDINKLDIEYRWNTRYILLDKQEALSIMEKKRKEWFSGRKSLLQIVQEQLTHQETTHINRDSEEKAYQVETEMNGIRGDYYTSGYYTCTIILKDENLSILEEKVKLVKKELINKGMVVIEETVNSIEAWFGSMPGNIYNNLRTPIVNSITFSHLIPSSAMWAGTDWNKHLNAPPLLYCQSDGSTPFRLNLHIGDVGHTLILGQTGGGKSVLLGTIVCQWRKYINNQGEKEKPARIYYFDKGGSSRVLTYAVGGQFYHLGEDKMSFQPLAYIDNEIEREWARDWIISILEQEGMNVSSSQKKAVWEALTNMASMEKTFRTMTTFHSSCQDDKIKESIESFTIKGGNGRYFDGEENTIKEDRWQVFEMEEVAKNKQIIAPLLQYLFHIIEKNLDGSPTLIILDEGWLYLQREDFVLKIQEWLKVLRKNNACVVFASQELSDIEKSPIFSTILEACKTKIFLPNSNAKSEISKELYYKFGLNNRELDYIVSGIPKKDYYYKSELGSRKFQLNLSKEELWLVASSSKDDIIKSIEIHKNYPEADDFYEEWFRYKKKEEINGENN